MQVSFYEVAAAMLACFSLAGVIVLAAVALGAYAVFRSKREAHEGFFQLKTPTGAVGSMDESFATAAPADDPVASAFKKMEEDNLRFLKQFAERKKEAGGDA